MNQRLGYLKFIASRAAAPGAWGRLARNPLKPILIVREILTDVKLRAADPAETIASNARSMRALSALAARSRPPAQVIPLVSLQPVPGSDDDQATQDLARLLTDHGSDKTKYGYHLLYKDLLGPRRQEPLRVLEIGLGTNNIDVPSNMGVFGRPGASLRAFRDYLPNALIFGADVDERILFTEPRIETYAVDQTDLSTLASLAGRFEPGSFDVIIDDGLHNAEAAANTILSLIGLLKVGGTLVTEDMSEEMRNHLDVINALLLPEHSGQLYGTEEGGYINAITRLS